MDENSVTPFQQQIAERKRIETADSWRKFPCICEFFLISHLLQSKNEQTLLYIGVKPCAKGSIYVALEWGYLYLTFFNISNNLFDFLTSNNLGVESEAGFGM